MNNTTDHQQSNINKIDNYVEKKVALDNLELSILRKVDELNNNTQKFNKQMKSIISMYYIIMKNTK